MSTPLAYQFLADTVLALHVAIVLFVVGGLVAVLAGNWRGWGWVNRFWFRLTHLAAIGIVVAEAWAGAVCPLTTLETWLRLQGGGRAYGGSFIEHWVQRLLYHDAPRRQAAARGDALMRTLVTLLLLAGALYAAACGAVLLLQRSMIYYPQPAAGRPPERLRLDVDGAQVLVAVQPRPGGRAVLYFGGNAEDVSLSLPELAAAFPQRAVYALHYRGYGGSTGAPTERALHADALALFDRVHASHPEVLVVGRSLGSGIALRLASQRPVSRLVLVTPFDSLPSLAAPLFPWLPVRWLLLDRYDSAQLAPRITTPTLVLAAERDEVVPRENTERLLRQFRPGTAKMVVIPASGHNTISASPAYSAALRAP